MRNDYESLSHTKWRCQYHIILTPKYRRQIIYGKYKKEIGKILRTLCERYGIEIIEANACKDHIHMLVSIPPKMSVSRAMGILKGKSALMIFDRFANLKYKYGNRHFWCRGYCGCFQVHIFQMYSKGIKEARKSRYCLISGRCFCAGAKSLFVFGATFLFVSPSRKPPNFAGLGSCFCR